MKMDPKQSMIKLRSSWGPATRRGALAAFLAVITFFSSGQAQDGEEAFEITDPQSSQGSALRFAAQGGFVHQSEADIEGPGGASIQVNQFDAGMVLWTHLSDRLRWFNTFHVGINDYDFDGGGFSAGNPWETILETRYGTQLVYSIDDRWGIRGGGLFMISRETDADWEDSFSGGGTFGVDYRHSDSLFLSLGLGVVSQIEDDAMAIPMLAVQWVPAAQWVVRVGAVPVGGGALAGAEVAYEFNDQWELGLGMLLNRDRFRLDDSGPAPDGVGEDRFLPLRLRLAWTFHPQFTLNFIAGMVLGGELKLQDEDGNNLRKEDYDPATYLGLRLAARF